jgi:hypothetical protein
MKVLTGFFEMPKWTGGRGHKAPYETTHVRVPKPLLPEVKRLIDRFHSVNDEPVLNLETSLDDAIVAAKAIVLHKKSARVSMEKLLTALYKTEVKL